MSYNRWKKKPEDPFDKEREERWLADHGVPESSAKDVSDGVSYYSDMTMEEFEIMQMGGGKKASGDRDKIFGNSYNSGEVSQHRLPDIKVRGDYAASFLGEGGTSPELSKIVMATFENSQWKDLPLGKKFAKDLLPYIFADLYKGIDQEVYSACEKFVAIAEFMDVSYEKVYQAAGAKIKELVLEEVQERYSSITNRKIRRLF